ncbi:hypothetical protein Nepgr_004951 [Nepenthes gracilis]|uniref:HMA domain-containing protein n=1 Tax=Nepenthes gracilis TaxID=150966 RepID=A0AAD3S2D0_NEPGR|nr:hypothetical protein Nepgr_004951 [Nepenthes gracilis]
MKNSKKMRGFMCYSPASTAACVPGNVRSVIVPRRAVDHRGLINAANYSRLVESGGRPTPATRRSTPPSAERGRDLQQPKQPQQLASIPSSDVYQVVVLRVSMHCQACAGKVKKHLTKMEGVTSFSIDLETKRVTVMGRLSPTGVLESISKVKRAELWS